MGSFYMEATQINYRRDETVKTVDQKLQELSEESAVDTDIAPLFSKTSTYNPGDLVYYKNKLYVCNTQHTGAWAAADFTATTVSAAMTASSAALDASKADYTDLAPAFDSESSYVAGDLVTYSGTVYRCTNDHTGAWDADDFSSTTISGELNTINSNLSGYEATTNAALAVPENTGKNVLPLTVDRIKNSTGGTWDGNTTVKSGITWTILTDGSGKVTGIKATGTATADSTLFIGLGNTVPTGNYYFNGCPTDGSESKYDLYAWDQTTSARVKKWDGTTASASDFGGTSQQIKVLSDNSQSLGCRVKSGFAIGSDGIVFYPMIRLPDITDAAFVPYIPSVNARLEAVESARFRVLANSSKTGTHSAKLDELTAIYDTLTSMERMHAIIHFNSYILPIADIYNKRFASTAKYVSEDKLVSYHVQLGTTGSTLFKAVTTTTGTTFTDMSTETDSNLSIQLLI